MTWRRVGFELALGVSVVTGCSAEQMPVTNQEMYTGRVSGYLPLESALLRVAYGRHWVVGGEVAANAMGEFQVPSSARAVVAYIDANHNGKFDRFAEPSGDCQLVKHAWSCSIRFQRITLHRAIIIRNNRHSDKTHIFWEDFRPDGRRVEDSRLCIEQRCTHLERGPFLSRSNAEVHEFSICGEEGFPSRGAEIRVVGYTSAVHVTQPAKFDVFTTMESSSPSNGALRLHIKSSSADRVLVWAGSVNHRSGDINNMHWSSEDTNIPIIDGQRGMEILLPFSRVLRCRQDPDCEIVIQLLKYWGSPGAATVSATEYRSTVTFRGPP